MKISKLLLAILALVLCGFGLIGLAHAGLNDGLVAYYPFNGNANDESGNGNHGTVYGATPSADRFGNPNSAYQFDGVNNYISVPSSTTLNPIHQLTISFWINISDIPVSHGWIPIIHKGGIMSGWPCLKNREYSIWFRTYPSQYLMMASAGDESCQQVLNCPVSSTNQWICFVAVSDRINHTMKLFINGVLASELEDQYSSYNNNTHEMRFGWTEETWTETFYHFKGILDDIRIYNRALSSDDVLALYNNYSPQSFLTVAVQPETGGTVTGQGVNCGSGNTDCTESYSENTSVTLTATANDGYEFKYWDDGVNQVADNPLVLSMDTDKQFTAKFKASGLNTGLVAYYPFNGNANDESGNGNHGTVYGATLAEDRLGDSNSAYTFDGYDDYVEVPNSSRNLDITGQFTLAAWVNPASLSYDQRSRPIIWKNSQCNINQDNYFLAYGYSVDSSPKFVVGLEETSSNVNGRNFHIASHIHDPGLWYHVTGVYDGTNLLVFVNGVQEGINNIGAINPYTGLCALRIGNILNSNHDNKGVFDGAIDEVRIYNRALSQDEITALYNNYSPLPKLTLTVDLQAGGTVTGQGITCGSGNSDCTESYPDNRQVTLTATANDGYEFEYWDDGMSQLADNPLVLYMDTDRQFTAKFKAQLTPTIAQSPMSWPPGTTFVQWGTGFTPSSTAKFHVKKPDGTEYNPRDQAIDGNGHFEVSSTAPWDQAPGTYTWWLIDGPTGVKSNEVSYEVTGVGDAILRGQVFDLAKKTLLTGATITAAGKSATSNASGNYSFTPMPSGNLTVKASKKGYVPVTEDVYVAPLSNTRRDFWLSPSGQTGIQVTSVSTRYGGQVCFIEGFDEMVTYTASVDWAGHPRGKVRFTTPKEVHDVPASGNTASLAINIGDELQECSLIKVKAISSDTEESAEVIAETTVMPNPLPWAPAPLLKTDMGDSFKYQSEYGFNMDFFEQGVDAGVIPEEIPIFGKEAFKLQFIPSVAAQVDSSGQAQVRFEWSDLDAGSIMHKEWGRDHNLKKIIALLEDFSAKGRVDKRRLPKAAVAGFDINLFPYLQFDATFSNESCSWLWGGQFGIAGEVAFSKSRPFILMAGPIPVPMYAKASLSLSMDAGIGLQDLDPLSFNGNLAMNPYARGSLGAGVDSVVAIEGWLGGGAEFDLQFPDEPTLNELSIYLNGGATVYAWLWKWENELLKWEWDLLGSSGRSILMVPELGPIAPKLVPRNYLTSPRYARFSGGKESKVPGFFEQGVSSGTWSAPLQSMVFPYSEPAIAAGSGALDLAWLYDNPTRSSVNRTMAVWSRWNGKSWSEPKPIEDDGTADFHPALLKVGNGKVFAAWEDEGKILSDTAQFEDMVKNLEISVAKYNATTKVWTAVKRLTSNGYLDRSPKLAGASPSNILLTWVANTANDIRGSSTSPNTLRYSRWNGSKWSTPQSFATIPYGFIKYDLKFDGAKGYLLMSLDTDNDPATINDHELFLLEYGSAGWGALQRLTDDNVSDENPQFSVLPDGTTVVTWFKGGKLVAAKDFATTSPVTIWEDQYSSNLADFKLADDQNGTIALVWAEPTEYSSDIYGIFYDRLFEVWGKPQRLTFDPQAERSLAPAFANAQTLMVVYDRTEVATAQVERKTMTGKTFTFSAPTLGTTDFYTLRYKVGGDLALDSSTFVSTPLNPHPGEAVTFTVTAGNSGDKAASNIPVAFYIGDPLTTGIEVGRTTIEGPMKPGDTAEVTFAWTIPAESAPSGVYAVIDPDRQVSDKNRSNNTVKRSLMLPDLAVQRMTWNRVADNVYEVSVRVMNRGAVAAGATNLRFRKNGLEGGLVSQQTIPKLEVFRSYDALTRIIMDGNETDEMRIYAVVDEAKKIVEFDDENNSASVLIE